MFAKGRIPAEETAKQECLRRWPKYKLRCKAVYYNGIIEGYVVERLVKDTYITTAAEKSASDAWSICRIRLEDINSNEEI